MLLKLMAELGMSSISTFRSTVEANIVAPSSLNSAYPEKVKIMRRQEALTKDIFFFWMSENPTLTHRNYLLLMITTYNSLFQQVISRKARR